MEENLDTVDHCAAIAETEEIEVKFFSIFIEFFSKIFSVPICVTVVDAGVARARVASSGWTTRARCARWHMHSHTGEARVQGTHATCASSAGADAWYTKCMKVQRGVENSGNYLKIENGINFLKNFGGVQNPLNLLKIWENFDPETIKNE